MTITACPHARRRKLALWTPLSILGALIWAAGFPYDIEQVAIGWVIATVGVLGLMGDNT